MAPRGMDSRYSAPGWGGRAGSTRSRRHAEHQPARRGRRRHPHQPDEAVPWPPAIGMGSGPSQRCPRGHRSVADDRPQHRGRSTRATARSSRRACRLLRAGPSSRRSPSASRVRRSASPRADDLGRRGSPPAVGCNRSHRRRGPHAARRPSPRTRSHGRPRGRRSPSARRRETPPPRRARADRHRRPGSKAFRAKASTRSGSPSSCAWAARYRATALGNRWNSASSDHDHRPGRDRLVFTLAGCRFQPSLGALQQHLDVRELAVGHERSDIPHAQDRPNLE